MALEEANSADELNLEDGWQEGGTSLPGSHETDAVDLTGLMEVDFCEDDDFHCSDGVASDSEGFDEPSAKFNEIICTVMQGSVKQVSRVASSHCRSGQNRNS